MIYQIIQEDEKAVHQACRVLQVSRSGYYAARQRPKPPAICSASVRVKAVFAAHQGCYGSRRIVDELHEQGLKIGRYKVRRLMREVALKPVWKKKLMKSLINRGAHMSVVEEITRCIVAQYSETSGQ
ncbi:MAG: transposase [Methylophilaceae bacterium]|nr:transposase [Methylophilaceae bacterium]